MVEIKSEKIGLITKDGVKLRATYFKPLNIRNDNIRRGLVLLHQFSKNKESWFEWIPFFERFEVLALDLRGHGESQLDYDEFDEKDFNDILLDVEAGKSFMEEQGFRPKNISYMGASIGANTVQNFVSKNDFDKAVLLSPGSNYKGIDFTFKDNKSLVVVSKEDEYSFNTVKKLETISPDSEFLFLEDKGHGTNMLDKQIIIKILRFLEKKTNKLN